MSHQSRHLANQYKSMPVYPSSDESGKQSLHPDGDRNRHQHLTSCSLAHCQPSLNISRKSVRKSLRTVGSNQTGKCTDKQTNNDDYITSLAEVTMLLLLLLMPM